MDKETEDWINMHRSIAADANGTSFLGDVGDWVTKGVPLAAASGVVSMYNTAVSFGNMLGADAEKIDLGAKAAEFDDSIGNYYKQHQTGIDIGGYIATSMIPGTLGIKALKMLQGGVVGENAAQAVGLIKNTERIFGYARNKEFQFTEKALDRIRSTTNLAYDQVENEKLLGIAFNVGDQALQGAAFQTAVLLTMNQSPVLAKPDEDYFISFIRNSSEIVTAGELQGAVGGFFGGIGIAGKLKKAIFTRDLKEYASLHPTLVGESSVDKGTTIAANFAYMERTKLEYEKVKAAGGEGLTDAIEINYQDTIKNYEAKIRGAITKDLLGGNEDAKLNNQIWKFIQDAPDKAEAANFLLTGTTRITKVGEEMQPFEGIVQKVMTSEGPLPARQAANLLKREKIFSYEGKIAPEADQIVAWGKEGFDAWRGPDGTVHVIETSDYATHTLPKKSRSLNATIIVKLGEDQKGRISETAFPVAGDIGIPGISKKGIFEIDGVDQKLPDLFDPLTNSPLESNMQFVRAFLKDFPKPVEEELAGMLDIKKGDLPLLEKASVKGFVGDVFYNGEDVSSSLRGTLLAEKLELRQQLMNKGDGFDKIARELNTTQEWAETGAGDGFMLSALENHTVPIHAEINFSTGIFDKLAVPDKFVVRGVEDLMSRVKLAYGMNQKAVAAVLGPEYLQLPKTDGTMFNVTTIPDLNTMLTSASPNYGAFDFMMVQVGKIVNTLKRERTQAVFQTLQGFEGSLRADPKSLIELNFVVNKIRSVAKPYTMIDYTGGFTEKLILPKSIVKAAKGDPTALDEAVSGALKDGTAFEIKNQLVADYLDATKAINSNRLSQWNKLNAARGLPGDKDVDVLYLPPINTRKYSYVSFVKEKMDMGPGDEKGAGVIVASTAEELKAKTEQIEKAYGNRFVVYKPSEVESWKAMQGEYENTPFLGDSMADSALYKEGKLYEFQPRIDDQILNDFNAWHWSSENAVIMKAIELKYAQEFAELRAMSKAYDYTREKFGYKGRKGGPLDNPYTRYINTALDKPSFDPVNSFWGKANNITEGIGQKIFDAWDSAFSRATKGQEDWETANKIAGSYGFTPPYKDVIGSIVQPQVKNFRNVQGTIAKANGAIATLTLGLDFLNSVVNVMSFPVLATAEMTNIIKNIKDPNIVGKLGDITTVQIPGYPELKIPTPMKLIMNSVGRLFSEDGKKLVQYYKDIGAIRTNEALYMDLVEASRMPKDAAGDPIKLKKWAETVHAAAAVMQGNLVEGGVAAGKVVGAVAKDVGELGSKAAEIGKSITLYNKAEFMVRYLAADMMKQITEISGISSHEAPAYINNYVNRVHGNYIANQRPHLFQGALGQAVSLFQTYQFNIMQNMVRYVESGDKTAAVAMLAMQNTLFGLQGNPAFYLVNQAIGNSNRKHLDIVNATQEMLGHEASKWVLYGLGSNMLQTSLYSRGDLTPRQISVIPISPADIPAVAIPAKAIGAFVQTIGNVTKDGKIIPSILDGIAHFGANRPLSGMAQLAQGYRTTSKGDLLTAYSELDGFVVASHIAGGEEINRAVALDAYYRNLAYKAKDDAQVQQIGEAVKSTMYAGGNPTQEQMISFMRQYSDAGGNPMGFNRFIQNNFKHANQSQMNIMKAHINSPEGRLQARMMGADTPDFYNSPIGTSSSLDTSQKPGGF